MLNTRESHYNDGRKAEDIRRGEGGGEKGEQGDGNFSVLNYSDIINN